MRNGRFHLPKYRGKVQKLRMLFIHSPKLLGPSLYTKNKKQKKPKKLEKGGTTRASL
jgi:hypothetical protein